MVWPWAFRMTEFKGVYLEPKRILEMDAQGLKTECEGKIIYNVRGLKVQSSNHHWPSLRRDVKPPTSFFLIQGLLKKVTS